MSSPEERPRKKLRTSPPSAAPDDDDQDEQEQDTPPLVIDAGPSDSGLFSGILDYMHEGDQGVADQLRSSDAATVKRTDVGTDEMSSGEQSGSQHSSSSSGLSSSVDNYSDLPEAVREHYDNHWQAFEDMKIDRHDMTAVYCLGDQIRYRLRPDCLGKGTYGTVIRAIDVSTLADEEPVEYAIKVSKLRTYDDDYTPLKSAIDCELRVYDKLSASPHPNLIECTEYFEGPLLANVCRVYSVLELSPIGDLKSAVEQTNEEGEDVWTPLAHQYCRHLIKGIAQGARHLFLLGIAHGDIKSENVLLFWAENTPPDLDRDTAADRFLYMVPKLIDFNSAELGDAQGGPIMVKSPRCTITTAAPETWFNKEIAYDMRAADVYSLGALLLSLLAAAHPFSPRPEFKFHHQTVEDQVLSWEAFEFNRTSEQVRPVSRESFHILQKRDISFIDRVLRQFDDRPSLKQLLSRALEPWPHRRISIDQFIDDQWFGET